MHAVVRGGGGGGSGVSDDSFGARDASRARCATPRSSRSPPPAFSVSVKPRPGFPGAHAPHGDNQSTRLAPVRPSIRQMRRRPARIVATQLKTRRPGLMIPPPAPKHRAVPSQTLHHGIPPSCRRRRTIGHCPAG